MAVILLGGKPPGLLPTDIAGLQWWFDAAENVYTDTAGTTPAVHGNTVRSWKDRQSNYLIPDSGAGTGPTLDTTTANGYPALVFDNANDQFVGTDNNADLYVGTSNTEFVVVKKANDTAQQNTMMIYDGATKFVAGFNAAGNSLLTQNYDGSLDGATLSYTYNNAWLVICRMNNGTNVYVGGNDCRTASMGSAASGNLSVGALSNLYIRNFPGSSVETRIAEIIHYNVALSESDRQEIERRLAWKYGITLPY